MNITDLHVDGFGVWSGLALDNLSEGLIVFYGPNEAGKTTLMQFIRSALYGFSPERRSRYLPPLRGDTAGGSINVQGADGKFWITRHDDPREPQGRIRIISADGAPRGPQVLESLLGGVDEATFNNVFAIGLRELQQLDTLSSTEAAQRLFQLASGLDRVSLVEVLDELESSRRRILAPSSEPSQVAQLVARREELNSDIQGLGAQSARYAQLARRRQQLERDVTVLEQDALTLQKRLRMSEVAARLRDPWRERAELDNQLAVLGEVSGMPMRALERLDTLNERRKRRKNELRRVRQQRKELIAEAKTLSVDRALWRQAPQIEVLVDQHAWIAGEEDQLRRIESDIRDIQSRIDQQRQSLGLPTGEMSEQDQLLAPSIDLLAKVRPAARKLGAARRNANDARREINRGQETTQALARQIGAALGSRAETGLTEALERAGTLVSRLRRRVQLDERIDQLKQHRGQLEDQTSRLIERQMLPAWILVGLGGLFVVGVVMILAGLFLPESLVGAAGWALAVLGLAGTASAAATKFLLERSAAKQLDVCNKQLDLVSRGLKQTREERDSLSSQLPAGGGPLLSRLEQAERELAELEELIPLDARRQAAHQQHDRARQLGEEARQELDDARRRWRRTLASVGIPEALSPKQVRHLLAGSGPWHELVTALAQRRQELASRQQMIEGFSARVRRVLDELGIRQAGDGTADQLRQLQGVLSEQRAAIDRRRKLALRNRRLRRQQGRLAQAARRLDSQHRELLRRAKAADQEEFRQRALEHARHGLLTTRREALDREITAALRGVVSESDLAHLLEKSTEQQLAAEQKRLTNRLAATQRKLAELLEQRGRLGEKQKQLAKDRRLGVRHLELAEVEQRLDDALGRWQVLAATHRLLIHLRERYERERQPETLGTASNYLRQLTNDRYTRVWTPLGENVLRVDDANGQTLSVEVLSRGTREQLFLSLRLALASCYARRGIKLPLVMDDLLVNFDADRAKAAATVLRDFASAGHQLFVFTCHQHIAKLFRSLRVPVRELPDAAALDAPTIAYVPPAEEQPPEKKPRRRRTVVRARRDDAVPQALPLDPRTTLAEEAGQQVLAQNEVPAPHIPLVPVTAPQVYTDETEQNQPHLVWTESGAEDSVSRFAKSHPNLDAESADAAFADDALDDDGQAEPADEYIEDTAAEQVDAIEDVFDVVQDDSEVLDAETDEEASDVYAEANKEADRAYTEADEDARELDDDDENEEAGDVNAETDEVDTDVLDDAAAELEEDLDDELEDDYEEEPDDELLAEDEHDRQQSGQSELEEDLEEDTDDDIDDEYEEYEAAEEEILAENEELIDYQSDEADQDDEEDESAAAA